MTCRHCCGADQVFDLKSAQKEMKSFQKKGASKSTKKLLYLMAKYNYSGKSLLDIGGGVGAIQWEFFQFGGAQTMDVDASQGYIKVASDYAQKNNFNARFEFGDFNDVSEKIDQHDFVTLDKVICCYPDYQLLLGNALSKTNEVIALTMPIGGPISKFFAFLSRVYMKIKGNPFRTYVHDPKKVHDFIESKGFQLSEKGSQLPWLMRVYERV